MDVCVGGGEEGGLVEGTAVLLSCQWLVVLMSTTVANRLKAGGGGGVAMGGRHAARRW